MNKRGATAYSVIGLLLGVIIASGLFLYFDNTIIRIITGIIALVLLISLLIEVVFHFLFAKATKIKRQLQEAKEALDTETIDVLKQHYDVIYNTYMELSANEKQNYYARLIRLREKLELILKNAKLLEEKIQTALQGSFEQRKKNLAEVEKLVKTLPSKEQQQFTIEIEHIRTALESEQ